MLNEGRITLSRDVTLLKAVVKWYNHNPAVTKKELYIEFYGEHLYQTFMDKGSLDKYLER